MACRPASWRCARGVLPPYGIGLRLRSQEVRARRDAASRGAGPLVRHPPSCPPPDPGLDNMLDALACAWTATRWAAGVAKVASQQHDTGTNPRGIASIGERRSAQPIVLLGVEVCGAIDVEVPLTSERRRDQRSWYGLTRTGVRKNRVRRHRIRVRRTRCRSALGWRRETLRRCGNGPVPRRRAGHSRLNCATPGLRDPNCLASLA